LPNDRASEVLGKVSDWLKAGCGSVWVVDPGNPSVAVYMLKAEMRILHLSDVLTDDGVLPGFQVQMGKIFP
jgi:hypothetical protein